MSQQAGYALPSQGGFANIPGQPAFYAQQHQYPPAPGYQQGYPPQSGWQQQAPQQQQTQSYQAPMNSYPSQTQQQFQPQQDPSRRDQAGPPPPNQAQVDRNLDPLGWALAEYGSPFAHSKDWRATPSDVELTGLPQQKLMSRVKQRFARSPGEVWDKPPPSFGRTPQQGWSYAPFEPFSLPAAGEQLADGFKPLYFGRVLADHDVSAADWARFLEDISVAGRMTGGQQVISNIAPVTMHLGATGYFVTKAIQKRMKQSKNPVISETVEMWEQNFFLRRGLDVYIRDTEGRMTSYAPGEPVPGSAVVKTNDMDQHSHDDSDNDSSDTDVHHGELSRKEKKKEREERKKKRKEEKKRKEKEHKKDKKKPRFYLIVAPYRPR